MKIAIIGAMDEEISFLLKNIENYKTTNYYKYTFYEGQIFDKDVVVVKCGIGKVASGLLVSALINYYKNIDLIINVGVSGGVSDKINIGDVVVASSLKYADVDVTIFNYDFGTIPNGPKNFVPKIEILNNLDLKQVYKLGMIISGDQFYHNKNQVDNLIESYFKNDNVLCIDMESAALAHSCWFYEVDYLAIRAISDVIGSDFQDEEYNKNLNLACRKSNLFLLEILEKI